MPSKIVLFFPSLEQEKPFHWFPLSLLSVAAPLVKSGYEVYIVDQRVDPEWRSHVLEAADGALFAGISSLTGYQLRGALECAEILKKEHPNLPIVWGGPHVTSLPDQSLASPVVDIVVRGFAEETIVEVARAISDGKSLACVRGIGYKSGDGKVHLNPMSPAPQPESFHRLPYELIDVEKYINPETQAFIYVTAYGCPGCCTFCSTAHLRHWIPMPLERIQTDIDWLLSRYKFKHTVFYDATLFADAHHAEKIIRLIGKRYGLTFSGNCRAEELNHFKEVALDYACDGRLIGIGVSVESGSPRILKLMAKGKKVLKSAEEFAQCLNQYPNVRMSSGIIFGYPTETVSDLAQTIEFIKKISRINPHFRVSTTFFQPLPGTPMYTLLERQGYTFPSTLEDWAEYGSRNHYLYNQFQDTPWLDNAIKDKYRLKHGKFLSECREILQ